MTLNRKAGRITVAAAVLVASMLTAANGHAQTPQGTFAATPTFGANGQALTVFNGGTVDQLEAAAVATRATGVWAQDATGAYQLLIIGGPPFLKDAFKAKFQGGFASATAVTLTAAATATAIPAPVPAPPAAPAATATRLSGLYLGSQTWSGELLISGDVLIVGDLTVKPGSVVRVAAGDDQGTGSEVAADGFNDRDPTRLLAYATTHTDIVVAGRLLAQGTTDQPITFTSASASPKLADWQGLNFQGDRSILEHVVVEYSRNGVTPGANQPNSAVRNSIIRHTMWGCISSGTSGMQILNNDISDCGHEGVDVKDGNALIRGNSIRDSHTGIVVLAGSPVIDGNTITNVGDGIGPRNSPATPILGQNSVTLGPPDSKLEWRYGDFAYTMFG